MHVAILYYSIVLSLSYFSLCTKTHNACVHNTSFVVVVTIIANYTQHVHSEQ